MDFEQHLSLSADALYRKMDDEIVILDMQSGQYFGLNEVGARIWMLGEQGESLEAIFTTLMGEFDVEAEKLRQDMIQVISDLVEEGLLLLKEPAN